MQKGEGGHEEIGKKDDHSMKRGGVLEKLPGRGSIPGIRFSRSGKKMELSPKEGKLRGKTVW